MNCIKIWFIRKLLPYVTRIAYETNDHILADNVIVIQDALNEIEGRLRRK